MADIPSPIVRSGELKLPIGNDVQWLELESAGLMYNASQLASSLATKRAKKRRACSPVTAREAGSARRSDPS